MKICVTVPETPTEGDAIRLLIGLCNLQRFTFYDPNEQHNFPYLSVIEEKEVAGGLFTVVGFTRIADGAGFEAVFASNGICWYWHKTHEPNEKLKLSWGQGVRKCLDFLADKLVGYPEEDREAIRQAIKKINALPVRPAIEMSGNDSQHGMEEQE